MQADPHIVHYVRMAYKVVYIILEYSNYSMSNIPVLCKMYSMRNRGGRNTMVVLL